MTVRVRFAPSPTGLLHVGNARVALVNWLFARVRGGTFVLRIDDTDRERSRPELAEAIERDLRWLGLDWGERHVQSERMARYDAALEHLRAIGRLYPCYETPDELAAMRASARAAGRPPVYDRRALRLDKADRARFEADGRRPYWRFRLSDTTVAWDDLVRGRVTFEGGHLSDPVLLREDGRPLYTLTSVVDDIELRIDHVIRGEDHVANTAVQLELFAALDEGAPPPAFAHLPLLADVDGRPLSKRLGSLTLEALAADGIEPLALTGLLARLGTGDPVEPVASLDDLLDGFDISRYGRASPRFDRAELDRINARQVHTLPWEAVADRLADADPPVDRALWEVVRENVDRVDDVREWARIVRDGPSGEVPVPDGDAFLAEAAGLLPPEPWDETTWRTWTKALGERTGRRGKALFRPLRLALTGRERGPELARLLPLIGRERTFSRLRGEPS